MRARRRDDSEPAIVEALESVGAEVHRELPVDLLVIYRGKVFLMECKTGNRKRKDQPKQDAFLARTNTPRVRTAEEALIAVGVK